MIEQGCGEIKVLKAHLGDFASLEMPLLCLK